MNWLSSTIETLQGDQPLVRVSVAATRGSTPREPGAWMLIGEAHLSGTIGGGKLEWEAIEIARRLLGDGSNGDVVVREWVLGPELGQCCGGRVTVWCERLDRTALPALRSAQLMLRNTGRARLLTRIEGRTVTREVLPASSAGADVAQRMSLAPDGTRLEEHFENLEPPLLLFGAGHVGQSIARLIGETPSFDLRLLDSRRDIAITQPGTPRHEWVADPVEFVRRAPEGAFLLVMTHDHEIDYVLCREALRDGRARFLGLIASESKAARFRSRLKREGLELQARRLLTSPIGLPGIYGKAPGIIAISVVAQLLLLVSARATGRPPLSVDAACSGRDCASCAPLPRFAP